MSALLARRGYSAAAAAHPITAKLCKLFGHEATRMIESGTSQHCHVTAVHHDQSSGHLLTLRIDEHAPKSATDYFILNMCRALSDVVVETGQIIRDEPRLVADVKGPDAELLMDWRKEVLRKASPPSTLILTRSLSRLNPAHPIFSHSPSPVFVFTSKDSAGQAENKELQWKLEANDTINMDASQDILCSKVAPHSSNSSPVYLVGHPSPSLCSALNFLRQQRMSAISIEAGPHTTWPLYYPTDLPSPISSTSPRDSPPTSPLSPLSPSSSTTPLDPFCTVDLLFLSLYSGPLPSTKATKRCVAVPVDETGQARPMTLDLLNRQFDLRHEYEADKDGSEAGWKFTVWTRKTNSD